MWRVDEHFGALGPTRIAEGFVALTAFDQGESPLRGERQERGRENQCERCFEADAGGHGTISSGLEVGVPLMHPSGSPVGQVSNLPSSTGQVENLPHRRARKRLSRAESAHFRQLFV